MSVSSLTFFDRLSSNLSILSSPHRDCLKDISLEAQNLIGNILEPDPLKR